MGVSNCDEKFEGRLTIESIEHQEHTSVTYAVQGKDLPLHQSL